SLQLFYDPQEQVFCFTARTLRMYPSRRKDIFDTSTPSSNSLFTEAMWRLSNYFHRRDYEEKVKIILSRLRRQMAENPTLASHFLQVALLEAHAPLAVIYRGENIDPLWKYYEPTIGWTGFISQSETQIPALASYAKHPPEKWFLCTYGACRPPVDSLEELLQLVKIEKEYLTSSKH
ncbi:MAG: hypothetical protein RMJ66_08280, partial [Bacteroidia bacterium]|nr:hypothetical protein [Bacteroidia bacterium]MDW8135044.1 hypothetical protein [Bacteroidia bacterium]